MTIENVNEVETEVKRLQKRIDAIKKRYSNKVDYLSGDDIFRGCKETGALKRAALDLKMELTKLT